MENYIFGFYCFVTVEECLMNFEKNGEVVECDGDNHKLIAQAN